MKNWRALVSKHLADVRSVLKDCGIKATDGRSALEVYEEYYELQKRNRVFHLIDFGLEFGLKFYYIEFSSFRNKTLPGFFKNNKIFINSSHPIEGQRFAAAYELGRFFYKYKQPGVKAREFAMALLVPKELIAGAELKWDLFAVTETIWNIRVDSLQK